MMKLSAAVGVVVALMALAAIGSAGSMGGGELGKTTFDGQFFEGEYLDFELLDGAMLNYMGNEGIDVLLFQSVFVKSLVYANASLEGNELHIHGVDTAMRAHDPPAPIIFDENANASTHAIFVLCLRLFADKMNASKDAHIYGLGAKILLDNATNSSDGCTITLSFPQQCALTVVKCGGLDAPVEEPIVVEAPSADLSSSKGSSINEAGVPDKTSTEEPAAQTTKAKSSCSGSPQTLEQKVTGAMLYAIFNFGEMLAFSMLSFVGTTVAYIVKRRMM